MMKMGSGRREDIEVKVGEALPPREGDAGMMTPLDDAACSTERLPTHEHHSRGGRDMRTTNALHVNGAGYDMVAS